LIANTPDRTPSTPAAPVDAAAGTRVPWLPIGASLVIVVAAITSFVFLRKRQTIAPSTG
jgi:hypothetical protein